MKVLFISGAQGADYQNDLVFHGLRSLLGPDCVDVNKVWFMYDNSPSYMFHTLYKLLPDIEVDRTDISQKICNHYFDAIVYGSIHRCQDYWDDVRHCYPAKNVAFVDGEDDGGVRGEFFGYGSYFKRELQSDDSNMLPIQFGVPKEKIRPIDLSRKTRLMAHCDPRDRSTYVYYDSEQRYYDQYSDAWFGWTKKKGGWDCMRHHEILAAGTLPYFEGFENCPPKTLYTFDRTWVRNTNRMYETWPESQDCWESLMTAMRGCLLTTEDIAKLILERVNG